MSAKLQGIFTPTLVPLDERGQINEPELRRFISWLIDHGVHGLYPNGSTGEFTRFSEEERRRIVQIVCSETRGRFPSWPGRLKPTWPRRWPPASLRRHGRAGRRHRCAVLLQAHAGIGLRLFRRDRPQFSHRPHAL